MKKVMVFLILIFFVSVSFAQAPDPGHDASSVGPGAFSGDTASVYAFPGQLNVFNNLFFPSTDTAENGVYWGNSQNFAFPHVNYASSSGIWISTGTTGNDVHIEGGNLVATEGITLGGETRTEWPLGIVSGNCPDGQVMIGVDNDGNIICDAFPSDVVIETGVVNHGQQIPLPAGITDRSRCKWTVSVKEAKMAARLADYEESSAGANTDANGFAYVYWYSPFPNYAPFTNPASQANYMIICKKEPTTETGAPETPPSAVSLDCTDVVSEYTQGGASATCPAGYPFALRGGCNSNCAWLARNEIVGNTQHCTVITNLGNFCTGFEQKKVRARITCCK